MDDRIFSCYLRENQEIGEAQHIRNTLPRDRDGGRGSVAMETDGIP